VPDGRQTRRICRVGAFYNDADETLARSGCAPDRWPGMRGFALRTAAYSHRRRGGRRPWRSKPIARRRRTMTETRYVSADDLLRRPAAVIGTGTLGRRVALMLATQGAEVRIYARSAEGRQAAKAYVEENLPDVVRRVPNGAPGRIVPSEDLASALAGVGVVVESVSEVLDLKKSIFRDLDALAPPDAILASNSSSMPSSRFIDHVARPERVVNMHFYMPPTMNVVEIMSCGKTDPAVIRALMDAAPKWGLAPYHVRRESTGFIFNRVWAAIKRESLAVVAEGVATPEDVDAIFGQIFATRIAPFRLMDMVGLDVVLDIEEHYATERAGVPEGPRKLLREYIAKGWLGRKSGRGFYDYER
jgi:3-hydroxybutyryl-CoA dehydrogenase